MLVVYCVDIIRLNNFTIESCVFTVVHVIVFTVILTLFLLCIFYHILECDILSMYLFLTYCVRKWHNKTVQSIIMTWWKTKSFSGHWAFVKGSLAHKRSIMRSFDIFCYPSNQTVSETAEFRQSAMMLMRHSDEILTNCFKPMRFF